jgi:hypothetical protein
MPSLRIGKREALRRHILMGRVFFGDFLFHERLDIYVYSRDKPQPTKPPRPNVWIPMAIEEGKHTQICLRNNIHRIHFFLLGAIVPSTLLTGPLVNTIEEDLACSTAEI